MHQAANGLPSSANLATRRRRDIQGLRAVAVLLVALDHAGVGFLKGGYVGVDVFFVLSGYLITGVLVKLVERTGGRAYFSTFYARRARRILPAATLTLLITDVAASHLLNLERAHQVLVDSVYSTFFVANIHFANVGTDYFAMGQPPSALQNFWSLSVEEQFYLVWPLLIIVALLGIVLTRSRHQHQTGHAPSQGALSRVGILAAGITVASFAYAVYDTHHSSTAAYFSSPARAWELGLGAVLALNARRVARLPPRLLLLCGWLGIAAIFIASIEYSPSTLFPGLPALLPTVGAAAVIAAGLRADQAPRAVSRVLSLAPFRYVGDRSYTFYLWHWPVLILAAEYADHSLSLITNLLLLAGAFVLSIVTYALFENPLRRTSKLQGSTALALWPVAIATVLFASSIYWSDYQDAVNLAYSPPRTEVLKETSEVALTASTEPAQSGWRPSSPAAVVTAVAAIGRSGPIPSPLIPAALALPSSEYKLPEKKCIAFPGETRSQICNLGDASSKKSLVVFGDSHAVMWMPAILSFAKREGYDVRPIMKYSCTEATWASGQCRAWYTWGVAQIRALHPSLVILAAHYNVTPKEGEISWMGPNAISNTSGFGDTVAPSARHVVVLGDPPGQAQEPTDCLLSSHPTMKTCSYAETSGQSETTAGMESAAKTFGVFLDTTPWFCYHGKCPMVVGHTIVNFNTNHITTEYAEELAPLLTTALTRLLAPVGVTKTPRPTGARPQTRARAFSTQA